MKTAIYLDYAAATPLSDEVLAAMAPYFQEKFYNPSASYNAGKEIRADIEKARASVASWFGAKSAEVIFTAGATEANNLAIHGVMRRFNGANILVANTEHEATLAPARQYTHELIPTTQKGQVDVSLLEKLVDDRTVLISVSYANNEIGIIQPLRRIAEIIEKIRLERRKKGNDLPLYLHADAAQAASYLDLHAARLGVDLLTINGSKMYGPKQMGALYVSSSVQLEPQITGGQQERGLRSGTENVAGIVGLAAALYAAQSQRKTTVERERHLRDLLLRELITAFPDMQINGDMRHRLPNNLNVSFPGRDGERILMAADEKGLQIATGAACSANKHTASHVLQAIGCSEVVVSGSLRFSVGVHTTEAEIHSAVAILKGVMDT